MLFSVLLLGTSLMQARLACADDDLTVADQKGQSRALLAAAGQDHDLPYHLHWTEFEAAAPLLQALAANAVDTGIAGDGPFLFAWGAHLPIKAAFLVPPRSGGKSTAVITTASSPIHNAADLSGKKIGTGKGSIGHLLLLRLLATGAIPAPAPRIVYLAPAQAKAALDTGQIDAWSTWEPYISLAVIQNHARVITDGRNMMPNNSFFVATTTALNTKHALLADFYRRMAAAYAWGIQHQAAYADLLARQTGLPLPVATAVARQLIASPAPLTSKIVHQEQTTLDAYRSAGFLRDSGKLDNAFDLTVFIP
ncbi:ABC transporter substrate-binding protein [Gluconobacter kanchanaburiensis]|uniref:Putative aliphatic sulfonates-binding protein n=1 Tax=Gluconobacter kanchanaburiensis NBRC 103587 TaxID=1307948 RepID=A0A511B4Q7_9PROT|nr:ABC transporter substrate-binding protein [Gluconobacter kanchanaburiensis]MBF0861758.1 ABC transporter substrate-binding protein [Gluconobacter kanchanaburiensis]GBR67383.1 nitrate/sulfonate/bicarbonate ABC transporter periplasmic protein [Gluconobacter kanchanaburiensis NBRC 103587]GEK95408.1 sulfonate ABC transporter substrate-binding protein [Gluconobacter kanchanaburiensis NBRC 103587]